MALKAKNIQRGPDDIDSGLRALNRLEPLGLSAEGLGWQQRKSAQTRVAILEATIDSLEQYGYAGTTTQTIGDLAKISRGAMMHHYSSKQELIDAVIGYTFYKRLEWITTRISALSHEQRTKQLLGIQILWESYITREFSAYTELSVASRTDPDLQAMFLPKAKRFDKIYLEEVARLHPDWPESLPFVLLNDFGRAALEGLANNIHIWEPKRIEAVRQLQNLVFTKIRQGDFPLPAAAPKTKGRGKSTGAK